MGHKVKLFEKDQEIIRQLDLLKKLKSENRELKDQHAEDSEQLKALEHRLAECTLLLKEKKKEVNDLEN